MFLTLPKIFPSSGACGGGHRNACEEGRFPFVIPAQAVTQRTTALWLGEGRVKFYAPRWEDMPTQAHIVNRLHELELVEYRGAMILESVGGFEGREQRILK